MVDINNSLIEIEPDQKINSIMVYTQDCLFWGKVVVKEQIRVSTWLRTNAAPERVTLFDAGTIFLTCNSDPKPHKLPEIFVPTEQIIGYHLIPPEHDSIDYDPTEPNRVMKDVTVMLNKFLIIAKIRMSAKTSLAKHLELARENYFSLYDAEIKCPSMPSIGIVRVPYFMAKRLSASFGYESD